MIEICRWTVSVVYGTTANVAGAAIRNFWIGPSLSNRIGTSESNLEASQVPKCESALGRSCAKEPRRWWLYRTWRLVVEYPQYTTSDISVTTCDMVAIVHRQPCLQHLACCSINSRHIGSESRLLPTPPAFDAPVRGVAVGISPSRLVWKN